MEAETSRFNLINVNATNFLSTPTVRGHAEACPSTTYTKQPPYLLPIAVAARCRDFYSIRYVARVGRVPGALLGMVFTS